MTRHVRWFGLIATLLLVTAARDWSMVGFGPGRTAFSAKESKITPVNVSGLTERWSSVAGTGTSSPVTSGGRVFVTTQPVGNTAPGELRAYDGSGCPSQTPAPCSPVWSVSMRLPVDNIQFPLVAPPLVAGGKVWAGSQGFDFSLVTRFLVYPFFTFGGGFDPSTGAKLEEGSFSQQYPLESAGTMFGYVQNAFFNPSSIGGNRYMSYPSLVARPTNGTGGESTILINPPVGPTAIVGGSIYILANDSVLAFDAAASPAQCAASFPAPSGFFPAFSCRPKWSARLGHAGGFDALPTVTHGRVYVPELNGNIDVFDAAGCGAITCPPLWTAHAGSVHIGPLAVTDDTMFAASDDGHLYALSPEGCGAPTCESMWSSNVGSPLHSPSVAGSVLFAGSEDGHLYAFDATGCGRVTCTSKWAGVTRATVRTAPVISDGRVFVTDDTGALHAFALTP